MKPKKVSQKLALNKRTVTNLNNVKMSEVRGGGDEGRETNITCMWCDSDESCALTFCPICDSIPDTGCTVCYPTQEHCDTEMITCEY